MSVLQQPEVIISGIESLRTVDDGQLEKKMGHAERELRDVKGEEERLLRFLVMGKISLGRRDTTSPRRPVIPATRTGFCPSKTSLYRSM